MIVFRTYNVIIPKFKIEDLIKDGMRAVYNAFSGLDLQEDEYLVAIGVANATEVRNVFESIERMGLNYDTRREASDDFVVMAKEGIWWPAPWLVYNDEGCWFVADVDAPASTNATT